MPKGERSTNFIFSSWDDFFLQSTHNCPQRIHCSQAIHNSEPLYPVIQLQRNLAVICHIFFNSFWLFTVLQSFYVPFGGRLQLLHKLYIGIKSNLLCFSFSSPPPLCYDIGSQSVVRGVGIVRNQMDHLSFL